MPCQKVCARVFVHRFTLNMWVVPLIFLLGLSVGSFLNVVIDRIHRNESFIGGRSRCPRCDTKLAKKDLIPVLSFLFLKGKCRTCKKSISIQYPLVELATGVLFTLEYLRMITGVWWPAEAIAHPLIFFGRDLVFLATLVVIFVYDLRYTLILDRITIPAILFALGTNMLLGFDFYNMLLGAAVVGGFFLLQFVISRGTWVGGGDIRLGVLMGVMLGLESGLVALFSSYVFGSFIVILLLLMKRKALKAEIAFGPFLVIGTYFALIFGDHVAQKFAPFLMF